MRSSRPGIYILFLLRNVNKKTKQNQEEMPTFSKCGKLPKPFRGAFTFTLSMNEEALWGLSMGLEVGLEEVLDIIDDHIPISHPHSHQKSVNNNTWLSLIVPERQPRPRSSTKYYMAVTYGEGSGRDELVKIINRAFDDRVINYSSKLHTKILIAKNGNGSNEAYWFDAINGFLITREFKLWRCSPLIRTSMLHEVISKSMRELRKHHGISSSKRDVRYFEIGEIVSIKVISSGEMVAVCLSSTTDLNVCSNLFDI